MSEKADVLRLLLAYFPELQVENDSMTELISHLILSARENKTTGFQHFFEVVEFHMIYGSEDVRKMLLVELLENLKNLASVQNLDYSVFETWLGPETHVAWRWLEKRWQGRTSLADRARLRDDERG